VSDVRDTPNVMFAPSEAQARKSPNSRKATHHPTVMTPPGIEQARLEAIAFSWLRLTVTAAVKPILRVTMTI
jgi:hypothetical protein